MINWCYCRANYLLILSGSVGVIVTFEVQTFVWVLVEYLEGVYFIMCADKESAGPGFTAWLPAAMSERNSSRELCKWTAKVRVYLKLLICK